MASMNTFYGGGGFGGINKSRPPMQVNPCKRIVLAQAPQSPPLTDNQKVYKKAVRRRHPRRSKTKSRVSIQKKRRRKSNKSKTQGFSAKKGHKKRRSTKSKKQVKFANF